VETLEEEDGGEVVRPQKTPDPKFAWYLEITLRHQFLSVTLFDHIM
jgi:hypothetical protein